MTELMNEANQHETLTAGTIPFHPGVKEYEGLDGKVMLYVRDNDEGRSLYMAIGMQGVFPYVYEVRYDDFADVISRMQAEVIMTDADDPFTLLLTGGNNG